MGAAEDYLDRRMPDLHRELFEFLAIPSISTEPRHAADVRAAAEWMQRRMERAGLRASVEDTDGHPVVLGRNAVPVDGAPTLLVYGHYDVQPAEPLDEWHSPPFEASVRDGILYARGAADDKTQILLQVAAAEAAIATSGLPINLILLFEGEEEVGSPSLVPLLQNRKDELRSDYAMIADSMMFGPRRPSLIFGMRGIAYFEIETRIGAHDLHSGQYGGAVPNAGNALAGILASLHHPDGRIALDAFYDDVADTDPSLRAEWAGLGFDEDAFRKGAGGAALAGEPGFTTPERIWTRPALDVNGILCGYTGPGKKTVLPCRAVAKLSFRLVPDQDPARVAELLEGHVRRVAPRDVDVDVRFLQANRPWREDPECPLFRAAASAQETVWGVPPVRVAHGGTLPIAPEISDALGAPVMTMGFALPGANMHAPNEWIPLDHFELGARTMLRFYETLRDAGTR